MHQIYIDFTCVVRLGAGDGSFAPKLSVSADSVDLC